MNLTTVDGYSGKIEYDSKIDLFLGEILGLNGGADFYGANPDALWREFKKSLDVFLGLAEFRLRAFRARHGRRSQPARPSWGDHSFTPTS